MVSHPRPMLKPLLPVKTSAALKTCSLRCLGLGAVTRTLGESWIYSKSKSRSDVSPLIAAAVALATAALELQVGGTAEIVIH